MESVSNIEGLINNLNVFRGEWIKLRRRDIGENRKEVVIKEGSK